MKPFLYAGIVLVGLLTACSSGKRLLQKGHYDEAVFKAVHRLQQKPESRDATATLKEAWRTAAAQSEASIGQWEAAPPSEQKWDELLAALHRLDALQRSVSSSPAAFRLTGEPAPVAARLQAAEGPAAAWYGAEAVRTGASSDPAAARNAFRLAAKSLQLRPDQAAVRQTLRKAYENACVLVTVQLPRNLLPAVQPALQAFNTTIQQNLPALERRNFVRFRTDARAGDESDEQVRFELQNFIPGEQRIASKVIDCVNDTVATEITDREGVRRRGVRTARARLTLYEGTLAANIAMSATVNGPNGSTTQPVLLPGTFTWTARWATFTGEAAALTPAQRALTQTPAAAPPPPAVLLTEAMKPVCAAALRFLNQRYDRGEISAAQWALLNP